MQKIHPKVEYLLNLVQQYALIEPLKELKIQEPDISFLRPDYIHIISHVDEIIAEYRSQPKKLNLVFSNINVLHFSFVFRNYF